MGGSPFSPLKWGQPGKMTNPWLPLTLNFHLKILIILRGRVIILQRYQCIWMWTESSDWKAWRRKLDSPWFYQTSWGWTQWNSWCSTEVKHKAWELYATYFGLISSMEAWIFMNFETYVNKIELDHQPNFHKFSKNARARGENAFTCGAFQKFRNESLKIKKMHFYFIHFLKPGKNIMSLLKRNIQIPPPLSTDGHP